MILFEGFVKKRNVTYIKFSNEQGSLVEIPLDERVAKLFEMHLMKLHAPKTNPVEPEEHEV